MNENKPFTVLDCDPGTDDACALFLLAKAGILPDLGIATFGNVPGETACRNLLLLKHYFHAAFPVCRGASATLKGIPPVPTDFHGPDGLAGQSEKLAERTDFSETELSLLPDAVQAADRLLAAGNVTYIATGPLTSLAELISARPELVKVIRNLYIMGGGLDKFNAPFDTEYNFFKDPDAANAVLYSGLPVTLFPLDITHRYPLPPDFSDRVEAMQTCPEMAAMIRQSDESNRKYGDPGAVLHDCLPVLYFLNPGAFVLRNETITVDVHGHLERSERGIPLQVAVSMEEKLLEESLLQAFRG